MFQEVVLIIGVILFISIILSRDSRRIPETRKSCYTDATSSGRMRCSKVRDNAFFPMESEDYAEAYLAARRYGS